MKEFFNKIKNLINGTFGFLFVLLFFSICIIPAVLAHIGIEQYFDIKINSFIFWPLLLIVINIPLLNLSLPFFATYAAYNLKDTSTFGMCIFVFMCILNIPTIIVLFYMTMSLFKLMLSKREKY